MRPLIMDARPLLAEYETYAPLFAFYQGGLKDLIKEAVITRSFNSPFSQEYHRGMRYPRGLAHKVVTDFEFALDNHHDLCAGNTPASLFSLEFATENRDAIRMVAEMVEEEVDKFLQYHLRTRLFEIAQDGYGYQHWPRWSGRDLIVYVRTLGPREQRQWFPFPD